MPETDNLTEELERTRRALEQARRKLESREKEMDSLIGIVSHDLRAPIINIQGFSSEIGRDCQTLQELLFDIELDPQTRRKVDHLIYKSIPESLQYVQVSSETMNGLVRTLVETARAGLAPTHPERLDMNELIEHVVQSIKIKFKEANVVFDILPLPECYADRTQVTQIFTNLLDNAVKYLDPKRRGEVCVEGIEQAGGVLYWVSDNGIGIADEDIDKIFEPFRQLKEKVSGGVGMGLVTVKKMIERNNGKIWVISEKGNHSIFYVALPAA